MIKAMRIALCVALMLAPAVIVADRQQQRAERWELAWGIAPADYIQYRVTSQRRVDPPAQTEGELVEPALTYAHYLGHELSPVGELDRKANPLSIAELLLLPAMRAPEGRVRAAAEYRHDWSFEWVAGHPPIQLASEYSVIGAERQRGADCVAIRGVHTLRQSGNRNTEGTRWLSYRATTTAWFDTARRRLHGARVELHAALWRGAEDGKREALHWEVEFQLQREIDTTGQALHASVAEAIERGAANVLSQMRGDGTWRYGNLRRGGTALALLTLLMCDVPADDPRIVRGFELLQPMEFENTYSVACSLMAYEARYITPEERRAWLSNPDGAHEFKRKLNSEDRREMERLVQWLKDNQNEANPFYNYARGHNDEPDRFDFSNTQYALLGLAAALRCDVRIPTGIIKPMVERIIEYQAETGPRVRRVIGYQPPEGRREARTTLASRPVEARGWNYRTRASWDRYAETTDAYGSMTTAGLTCLLVGLEIARSMGPEDFRAEFGNRSVFTNWERRANESLDSGMAWLEHWYSVTRNPNRGQGWYFYHMYGLERVMVFAGSRWLGTHNWYNQGAAALVATQDESGGWGNLSETCLALLFLKKGTVPPRRRVITGE
jgi:hypothetical protein